MIQTSPNLFLFVPFVLCLYFQFYIQSSLIYLDEPIVVKATVEGIQFSISGEVLSSIAQHIGTAGVFTAGAKIAAAAVSKKMHIFPKAAIITGTASGMALTFRVVNNSLPSANIQGSTVEMSTGPVELKVTGLNFSQTNISDEARTQLLTSIFPSSTPNGNSSLLTSKIIENSKVLSMNNQSYSEIIDKLNTANPN